MLKGNKVFLRMVEPSDATKLLLWENNPHHWKVTDTEVPFSMHAILQLIEQQQQIRSTGQLRMIICDIQTREALGAIDLYDVDFRNGNAAVGILIGDEINKGKGYAKESLQLMIEYAKNYLALHNLYCSIQSDNELSISLFKKNGFQSVGIRKEWYLHKGKRIDEHILQLCLKD